MSKSSPTTSAGSPPPAADPALLGRHEAALRTYLTGLQGAQPAQVDTAIREIMREAAEQLDFEDDPVVWLFTQGRRRVASGGQRGDVLVDNGNDGAQDEEAAAGEDPAIVVHRAFGRLTNKQQEMLRLKFQFGFSLEELARITGVSQSGAGGLLHSAVERIGRAAGSTLSLGAGRGGDVRLTAYALDEMLPAEKQAFAESVPDGKALLESSDAIRKIGQQLTRVLESGAPLPKRQRRRRGAAWWKSPRLLLGGLAVALLAAGGWYFLSRPGEAGNGREAGAAAQSDETGSRGLAREDGAGGNGRPAGGPAATDFSKGSGRSLRPGEAEWERKSFGRGPGGPGGTAARGPAAGAANPAQPGGTTGPASAAGGERSPGTPTGLPEKNDPAAENRGESGKSDEDKQPATAGTDSPDGASPAPGAAAASGGAAGSGAAPNAAAPRELKPAKPDLADEAEKPPASPTAASPMPAKKPQLPVFNPMRRDPAKRPWPKPANFRVGEMLQPAPAEAAPANGPDAPVAVQVEVTYSPWKPDRQIVRATAKARQMRGPARPPVNLVFAIDVSGSMAGPNRLPLVQEGIRLLAERLRPEDRVAVVTYAAQAKEILPGNPLGEKGLELRNGLAALAAAGRTNGYEGLQLAYATARRNRVDAGLNVVVLCTDGNFNLGETDDKVLAALAAQAAADGIKLSVFGFGRTDRNDLRLELLATQGGGRSCYVNTREEAERLLAGQVDGLVETVAKEVALGVRFDPARVGAVARIDGGEGAAPVPELLSGRSLTALYEIAPGRGGRAGERMGEVEVDYLPPGAAVPAHLGRGFDGVPRDWAQIDAGFRFAIAWAEFGRIVQEGNDAAGGDLDRLESWVKRFLPDDGGGYRRELLDNVAAVRLGAP